MTRAPGGALAGAGSLAAGHSVMLRVMEGSRPIGVEHPRCPYCHEAVVPGDERKQSCNACMAWHHEECWSLHGGCSACGRDRDGATKPRPARASGKEAAKGETVAPERAGVGVGRGAAKGEPPSGAAPRSRPFFVLGAAAVLLALFGLGVAVVVEGPGPRSTLPATSFSKRWLEKMEKATTEEEKTRACREGAEEGDPAAMNFLGHRLAGGIGCQRNDVEAVRWGKRAAELGNVEACYGIGLMYEFGHGVPRSDEEAVRWYRRALAGGDTLANEKLKTIFARRPDLR